MKAFKFFSVILNFFFFAAASVFLYFSLTAYQKLGAFESISDPNRYAFRMPFPWFEVVCAAISVASWILLFFGFRRNHKLSIYLSVLLPLIFIGAKIFQILQGVGE